MSLTTLDTRPQEFSVCPEPPKRKSVLDADFFHAITGRWPQIVSPSEIDDDMTEDRLLKAFLKRELWIGGQETFSVAYLDRLRSAAQNAGIQLLDKVFDDEEIADDVIYGLFYFASEIENTPMIAADDDPYKENYTRNHAYDLIISRILAQAD